MRNYITFQRFSDRRTIIRFNRNNVIDNENLFSAPDAFYRIDNSTWNTAQQCNVTLLHIIHPKLINVMFIAHIIAINCVAQAFSWLKFMFHLYSATFNCFYIRKSQITYFSKCANHIVISGVIYMVGTNTIIIFELANECDCVGKVIGAYRWRIAIFPRRRRRPPATGVPGLKSCLSFPSRPRPCVYVSVVRLMQIRHPVRRADSSSLRRKHFQRDRIFRILKYQSFDVKYIKLL